MAKKLRLTTFNCENLFGRYAFLNSTEKKTAVTNYEHQLKITEVVTLAGRGKGLKPAPISEQQRQNTAATIVAAKPDILAVAEVENLITLRLFNAKYLKNYFDRIILIDGNDPRGIDVGLLVRRGYDCDLANVRSNSDLSKSGGILPTSNRLDMKKCLGNAAFSRDCLEVDIDVGSTKLTLLVNHLKAQETKGNVDASTQKRRGQAAMVAKIVDRVAKSGRRPIVMGDLNKDIDSEGYDGSLDPLVNSKTLVDPFADFSEKWTHYYASKRSVSRLDYILVDKKLAGSIASKEVFRGGLAPSCKQYPGERVGDIAKSGLEASDHCPVTVVFSF